MNKQGPNGIEWTNYTWNPVGGCKHACRWTMPDGTIAICYAETTAEKVAQRAYPEGFQHHYWRPHMLKEPQRVATPSRIFIDSMSDLMGTWVPDEQIQTVLDVIRACPQHSFQLLTKNAPRLRQFEFPPNLWVGVSTPPDYMFGKKIDARIRTRMMETALKILAEIDVPVKWISAEPLTFPLHELLVKYPTAINWCVVGAASSGKDLFAPDETLVQELVCHLDMLKTPVFYKGNMRVLPWAADDWREEYPTCYELSGSR